MTRAKRRWAAVLCGLLGLAENAHAQSAPRLGLPDTFEVQAVSAPPVPLARKSPLGRFPGDIVLVGDKKGSTLQLDPPDNKQLLLEKLKSENDLFEQFRLEFEKGKPKHQMPKITKWTPVTFRPARDWDTLVEMPEPSYLCYGRLWFEQRNAERHGWDLGVIHPPISALLFYTDVAALPIRWLRDPLRFYDCNTGLCLPGDPTPLMWYRLSPK